MIFFDQEMISGKRFLTSDIVVFTEFSLTLHMFKCEFKRRDNVVRTFENRFH